MEFWSDIYRLYGVVVEIERLLAGLINGRLGEYDKASVAVMEQDWLPEQLKTIKNLCDTALLLIEHNRRDLLPTTLELLHYYTQTIIDKECIVGEG